MRYTGSGVGRLWSLGTARVSAGVQADRKEGGRGGGGSRDQFCQNWVHTPGATELGWPREKLSRRAIYIIIG